MVRLEGCATPAGTDRFCQRSTNAGHAVAAHFRPAPGSVWVSSIGLGSYLGRPDAATDRLVEEAVGVCVRSGRLNVLDTAINYRHQRAERSIGRALARAVEAGAIQRDEVFLASKVGYLAPDGESGLSPAEWIRQNLVEPGVLTADEVVDGSHSMAPAYLEDQVRRSLENLGAETLDLLYLHNAADAQLPAVGHDEFFRRLSRAFDLLERCRKDGRIRAYGIATWDALRSQSSHPAYLSLEEVVHTAEEAGGRAHGFRFIQFPFNIAMPEAAVLENQRVGTERTTLFRAAARLGLGCFTSVPLYQGQLARSGPGGAGLTPAATALQFARSVEGNLSALVGQKTPTHLAENLALATVAPWDGSRVTALLGQVRRG